MTPAKLVASLPRSIRVGPNDIAIVAVSRHKSHEDRRYGVFSSIEQKIEIEDEPTSCSRAADTFIHEVNHAIWWTCGIEDGDMEERIVGTISTAWAQVYRDNPWLLKWLARALA